MDIYSLGKNHDACVKYMCDTSFKEPCQNQHIPKYLSYLFLKNKLSHYVASLK